MATTSNPREVPASGRLPNYSRQSSNEQNSDVVTILLIGLTQAGKSTFVNWLREISQGKSEESEAIEGDGNASCTKKCGIWEIQIRLSDYKLVDRFSSDKDIPLPNKELDLLRQKGRWTKENSKLTPITPNGPLVTFRIVDTPGLDDSDQADMKNILEVLGTMNSWLQGDGNPTVNGLIFLMSCASAFPSSFQELFKYYQRCMPNLFGGLAMVNTKFSIKEWKGRRREMEDDGKLRESQSARAKIVEERRADFKDLFGRDPPHWYLDSKPDPDDNLERLLSLNSTMDLLRVMAAQQPSKISHMNYVKMAGDMAVDAKIKGLLESKMLTWMTYRKLIMEKSSAEKKLYINNQERVLEYKQMIEDLASRLKRVDHEEEVQIRVLNTEQPNDVGFLTKVSRMTTWGGVTKTLEVDEKYKSFDVRFLDNDAAKWLKREKNPTTNGYIGTYKAAWGKFPLLYAHSYTRSSVAWLEDIKKWKREKYLAETCLDNLQLDIDDTETPPDVDERLDRLLLLISQSRDVIAKLDLEMVPIEALDTAASRRYKKDPVNINAYDAVDAIRTYQPFLADSWDLGDF